MIYIYAWDLSAESEFSINRAIHFQRNKIYFPATNAFVSGSANAYRTLRRATNNMRYNSIDLSRNFIRVVCIFVASRVSVVRFQRKSTFSHVSRSLFDQQNNRRHNHSNLWQWRVICVRCVLLTQVIIVSNVFLIALRAANSTRRGCSREIMVTKWKENKSIHGFGMCEFGNCIMYMRKKLVDAISRINKWVWLRKFSFSSDTAIVNTKPILLSSN